MNINYESFESNDDACEWLLGTLLKWAMKGTSQGKNNTLLRLVIKKVFILCPCNGVAIGYPWQDIEDALIGRFNVSFDFDDCGGGKGNFCTETLSKYKPSLGIISCTSSLISRLSTDGNHCVSNPVIQSSNNNEGDKGSLEWTINSLIDDNGANFIHLILLPTKNRLLLFRDLGWLKKENHASMMSQMVQLSIVDHTKFLFCDMWCIP